LSHHQALT